MSEKTNAMRLLDQRRIPYQVFSYSPEIHSATEVAAAVGYPPGQVFKTLVVLRTRGRPLLVIVPGDREIDLRLLARAVKEKSLQMAPHKDAEHLTGLKVGGISALALLDRHFDVCLDRAALAFAEILVSAGQRGINLKLKVADLVRVTGAKTVEATAAGEPADEPATEA